jgi:chlorophyllide a reductase subunit Y
MLAAAAGGRQERRAGAVRADYPRPEAGPHDQPQSMCPAFGSLRVGLRMRRTATILSGSACCVYGLTFTSHFYGARRSVGYVPFNSESLVTGKLFEDIREAVHQQADPALLRRHRHHQPVRAHRQRRAAAAAAQGDQRRAHHRHRRAGLRRAHPCRGQGRAGRRDAASTPAPKADGRPGAGAAQPGKGRPSRPSRCWARCSRPTRDHRHDARADGPGRRPGGARRANGASCMPRWTVRWWPRSTRSTPPASASSRPPAAGRGLGAGGPRRHRGLAAGHRRGLPTSRRRKIDAAKNRFLPAIKGALAANPIKGRITLSGYEGSELLVARLLVESGADLRYVGTACPRTPWSDADRDWLEARGVHVQYRASLEQDLAAMQRIPARPGHRHHAGGAGGQGGCASRRCTSPT